MFLVSVWIFFEAAVVEICYTLFQKKFERSVLVSNGTLRRGILRERVCSVRPNEERKRPRASSAKGTVESRAGLTNELHHSVNIISGVLDRILFRVRRHVEFAFQFARRIREFLPIPMARRLMVVIAFPA